MAKAAAADAADIQDGMSIPDELARATKSVCARSPQPARRSKRALGNAARATRRTIKPRPRRATPRPRPRARSPPFDRLRGKKPPPPAEGPRPGDQINLTDEDSRIMPMAGGEPFQQADCGRSGISNPRSGRGGFEQCTNAQAAVAAGSLLVVAVDVVLAANDKQQLAPMLGKIGALPEELDDPETLLADAGYLRGQWRGLRDGRDRTADRHRPSAASSAAG
jgi:hypothetical protein